MSHSWVGTAAAYDVSFARLCAGTAERLLASLGSAAPGASLLDVGCGPGTVAVAAQHAGFDALGVDADASMLALARRKHPGLTVVQGALPDLPFGPSRFDAVAANFVVNHTPDPRASVREMRRVTRPGGRLALTIWTGAMTPLNQLWNDVLATASVSPPAGKTLPPDKDFERTTTGIRDLLTEAGLADVVVQQVHWLFCIAADDLWRAVAGGVATIGRAFQAQPPPIQDRMRNAFVELVHERHPDGKLRLPTAALLASARRDASPRR